MRAGVLLTGLFLAVPGAPAAAQFDAGIAVGKPAPVLSVPDLEGVPVDLGQWIGKKPVLIEFWATWCSVCKTLLPELGRVQKAYGDRVVMLGINITVNDSRDRVRRYMALHKPPFVPFYDDKGVSSRAYEVPTTSFIVIVGADGKVAYTGSGEDQDLVGALRKILGS